MTNPKDIQGKKKVPLSPISFGVMFELGLAMQEGAMKYGRHNYRTESIDASVYLDAVMRHMGYWWEGQDIDPDSGLHHVTKAIATLFVLRDSIINGNFNDDRPPVMNQKFMDALNNHMKILTDKYPDPKPVLTEKKDGTK